MRRNPKTFDAEKRQLVQKQISRIPTAVCASHVWVSTVSCILTYYTGIWRHMRLKVRYLLSGMDDVDAESVDSVSTDVIPAQ